MKTAFGDVDTVGWRFAPAQGAEPDSALTARNAEALAAALETVAQTCSIAASVMDDDITAAATAPLSGVEHDQLRAIAAGCIAARRELDHGRAPSPSSAHEAAALLVAIRRASSRSIERLVDSIILAATPRAPQDGEFGLLEIQLLGNNIEDALNGEPLDANTRWSAA